MKAGYLYVLVHPSDPALCKIGQTTRHPEKRLAEHNSNYKECAGRIVKETGQKWEIKTYIAVPDPTLAESIFWNATPSADIPFQGGIEVKYNMKWEWIEKGLEAAKKTCVRPPPKPLADWVYAYTAWMNKRLEGRDVALVGRVTSRSGKATFRCTCGHQWRTRSADVAEGEGCPQCGIGQRKPEEVWQAAKLGYLCLLTHPDTPGFIKIGLTYGKPEKWHEEHTWGDWEVHRYRFVEEPVLAETLIWELLGQRLPNDCEPIKIDLRVAEQAFRDLIQRLHLEIALVEMKKRRHPENGLN
jgi:T5orf172 domain